MESTGSWFLDGDFKAWRDGGAGSPRILWLRGKCKPTALLCAESCAPSNPYICSWFRKINIAVSQITDFLSPMLKRIPVLLQSNNSSHISKKTPKSAKLTFTAPLMTGSLSSLSTSWGQFFINSQNSIPKASKASTSCASQVRSWVRIPYSS